jgi:copper chaperone
MRVELRISGMNCQHCVRAVTDALSRAGGVSGVQVELEGGLARIEGTAPVDALVQAVLAAGYQAEQVAAD